jgi:hypothetical protein
MSNSSYKEILQELTRSEGLVRGLYRGAVPPLIGGSLFRSAQFGVFENTKMVRLGEA